MVTLDIACMLVCRAWASSVKNRQQTKAILHSLDKLKSPQMKPKYSERVSIETVSCVGERARSPSSSSSSPARSCCCTLRSTRMVGWNDLCTPGLQCPQFLTDRHLFWINLQVNMSEISSVDINWKMLTLIRPGSKTDEQFFTK